jgi:CheY-like chemotaxis protein
VITARRAQLAAQILQLIRVDLIIVEVDSEEVSGFKLLSYLSKNHPKIPVVAIGASLFSKFRSKLENAGVARYFQKSDMETLIKAIVADMNIASEGRIQGISLPSFLQLINMEEKTCTLRICSGTQTGYIYCQEGELIAAETGNLKGKAALFDIIFWKQTRIQVESICKKQEVQITEPLAYLLMESHRLRDEQEEVLQIRSDKGKSTERQDVHKGFMEMLGRNMGVYEYAMFDRQDSLEEYHSPSGSLLTVTPSPYLLAAEEIRSLLHSGVLQYMVIHTKGGIRYSLFQHLNRRFAVALKPGVKPSEFMKDIRRDA